tara:strand:- start:210 stop:470 length:261 start_codon:yes stop_codon:yes gene_type:complete
MTSNVNQDDKNLKDSNKQPDLVSKNVIGILLYALSLATALGFNDLILTIFDSFNWTAHIIAKTTYVILMFFITIGIAYYIGTSVNR